MRASQGMTGADIDNVVNTALVQAIKSKMTVVNQNMLLSALDTVKMGIQTMIFKCSF